MRKLVHPAAAMLGSRRVWGAVVATAGLFGSAAVASAITPGEPFTVSPGQGGPFTTVNVSGANCTDGPAPFILGTVLGSPDVGIVALFTASPDANGDWAATFTVPPNRPAGQYQVTAKCMPAPNQFTGDDYGNQPFTIVPGPPATMTVSPRSAQAGSDVTVNVSGTLCRGQDAAVSIGVFARVAEEFGEADEFVVRATSVPDDQGNWTTQLTIPASTAPGIYGVEAQCLVADLQFFLYGAIDVSLSAAQAPPAVPVARQPSFTG